MSTSPEWLINVPTCPSTNSWAIERLDDLAHGTCVYTAQQTQGRGQQGRSWVNPPGTLTVSYVLHLPTSDRNGPLGLIAGLAVAHAIEDHAPQLSAKIKWPNDIYISGRKAAGLLCEARINRDRHSIVVGIGLNINTDWTSVGCDPDDLEGGMKAISLAQAGADPIDHMHMATTIRTYLIQAAGMLTDGRWPKFLPQLRERDWLSGKSLRVRHTTHMWQGQGAGIDDDGNLLLASPSAGIQAITAGTVEII